MVAKISHAPCLGQGLYSVPESARLLGVSVQKLRRWTDPNAALIPGVLFSEYRTLTFVELMELHFVKLFRESGVSLQTIRRATRTAARQFNTTCPFTVHQFDTDGHTVFATLIDKEHKKRLVEDLKHGQYVFEQIVRPFFKNLEYSQNGPVRFWPPIPAKRVVLDPKRHFGQPIDAQTGVPTRALHQAILAGEDIKTVAEWFNVPVAAVDAAIEFEKSLRA